MCIGSKRTAHGVVAREIHEEVMGLLVPCSIVCHIHLTTDADIWSTVAHPGLRRLTAVPSARTWRWGVVLLGEFEIFYFLFLKWLTKKNCTFFIFCMMFFCCLGFRINLFWQFWQFCELPQVVSHLITSLRHKGLTSEAGQGYQPYPHRACLWYGKFAWCI